MIYKIEGPSGVVYSFYENGLIRASNGSQPTLEDLNAAFTYIGLEEFFTPDNPCCVVGCDYETFLLVDLGVQFLRWVSVESDLELNAYELVEKLIGGENDRGVADYFVFENHMMSVLESEKNWHRSCGDVFVDPTDDTIHVETDGALYKYRLVPVEMIATKKEKRKGLEEILSEYLIDWPDLSDRKFQ